MQDGPSRQDVAADNTAGNSHVRNASVDPRYASLPRSWKQREIIGDPVNGVQGFLTDAEANRAGSDTTSAFFGLNNSQARLAAVAHCGFGDRNVARMFAH